MYAGTTIRHGSGRIVGVHQKIDRAARRHLKHYLRPDDNFPMIKDILHFEGNNGPDGLKRKNPALDRTWYFIDPGEEDTHGLLEVVSDHIYNLTEALKKSDEVKAAFEAAWLAHAVVDALTPAHHYPLSDKIKELWGKDHHERSSIFEKNIVPGVNIRDKLLKNWEYWNTKKGIFTIHGFFELGVASAISTENYKSIIPPHSDFTRIEKEDFEMLLVESISKIDELNIYEEMIRTGWTKKLANKVRKELLPEMIRVVTLAWYKAVVNARVEK